MFGMETFENPLKDIPFEEFTQYFTGTEEEIRFKKSKLSKLRSEAKCVIQKIDEILLYFVPSVDIYLQKEQAEKDLIFKKCLIHLGTEKNKKYDDLCVMTSRSMYNNIF